MPTGEMQDWEVERVEMESQMMQDAARIEALQKELEKNMTEYTTHVANLEDRLRRSGV